MSSSLVRYAAVAALARAGNAGLPTAIILSVLAAGGSASGGSLIVASASVVAGVMGPFIGAFVDRLEHPKRGYVAALSGIAVACGLLSVGVGSWPSGLLVFIAAGAGLCYPMLTGVWSAQLRRIAPSATPARAYAVDVGTYNVADILGPAVVGAAYIYDSVTPGASALEVVLVLYVSALVVLSFVRVPRRSETRQAPPEPVLRTMQGLGLFWKSVSLRRSTTISTIAYAGIAGIVVAAPLLGADLAGDPGVGALLLAVIAAGALTGSLVLARWPIRRIGPGTTVVVATLLFGLLIVALAASTSMYMAVPLAFLLGTVDAPQLSSVMQVRDRESEPHTRGLVFSAASSLKTGGFAVGSIIAALLAPGGWRVLLLGSACIEILAVILGLLVAVRGRARQLARTDPPKVGEPSA